MTRRDVGEYVVNLRVAIGEQDCQGVVRGRPRPAFRLVFRTPRRRTIRAAASWNWVVGDISISRVPHQGSTGRNCRDGGADRLHHLARSSKFHPNLLW